MSLVWNSSWTTNFLILHCPFLFSGPIFPWTSVVGPFTVRFADAAVMNDDQIKPTTSTETFMRIPEEFVCGDFSKQAVNYVGVGYSWQLGNVSKEMSQPPQPIEATLKVIRRRLWVYRLALEGGRRRNPQLQVSENYKSSVVILSCWAHRDMKAPLASTDPTTRGCPDLHSGTVLSLFCAVRITGILYPCAHMLQFSLQLCFLLPINIYNWLIAIDCIESYRWYN